MADGKIYYLGAFAALADPVGNEFGLYEEPKR
jgi:hypothetical protein